jgi:putative ATP-binding cassette transporter
LAGLYPPDLGEIYIDNSTINDVGLTNYRSVFSMVLMNFHLFEQLYGVGTIDTAYCQELLGDMQLDKKIFLENSCRFSSTELSSGQRKRLAVVAACLEKKDVLLFDEVAADFDPGFRKFFYEEFIPKLRKTGKTILAISHDDRYYHVADRVITMRYGKIESTKKN